MSKVTYLWGAGASFGERSEKGNIVRGVPIISEFPKAISSLISSLLGASKTRHSNPSYEEAIKYCISDNLELLQKYCASYPTIDTYAKMLFVTQKYSEYERLKQILSVFLLYHQITFPRDLRYDGFIASLIDQAGNFPNINILTWNYDIQFETAYADYSKSGKFIPYLWNELNVINKTIGTQKIHETRFSITKLNGMALFINKNSKSLIDLLNGGYQNDKAKLEELYKALNYISIYKNTLSYAWERNGDFITKVSERVKDTTSLVVIGYSFPYVNREIDRAIIQNMEHLERVYIQDPFANEIKESVEAVLSDKMSQVDIITKTNTKQFFIPNEL